MCKLVKYKKKATPFPKPPVPSSTSSTIPFLKLPLHSTIIYSMDHLLVESPTYFIKSIFLVCSKDFPSSKRATNLAKYTPPASFPLLKVTE